jgi:hypothetical protein
MAKKQFCGSIGWFICRAGWRAISWSYPYYSNIPPREVYLEYLKENGYESEYEILKKD